MITLPIYVIFLVFLAILMSMELNRRRKLEFKARITELENSLDLLKEELDELEALKSGMLSRIGTSLKKPLEAVKATVIELSRPLDRSPEVREQLALLTVEIEEIEKFLNLMKELATLEKMDLTLGAQPEGGETAALSLDGLLFETLDEWNDTFSERGISLALSLDEDLYVSGSRYYLRHALDNILSEMTRAVDTGSLIHVLLKASPKTVRLSLSCRGGRLKESEQSAFGVELARQIVSAHDGWLTEDTESLQYTLELPLKAGEGRER